eukprot:gene19702-30364_t
MYGLASAAGFASSMAAKASDSHFALSTFPGAGLPLSREVGAFFGAATGCEAIANAMQTSCLLAILLSGVSVFSTLLGAAENRRILCTISVPSNILMFVMLACGVSAGWVMVDQRHSCGYADADGLRDRTASTVDYGLFVLLLAAFFSSACAAVLFSFEIMHGRSCEKETGLQPSKADVQRD